MPSASTFYGPPGGGTPSQAGIRITGLVETAAMLEDAPKNIVMLGYARALYKAIAVIAEAVVARTPVIEGDLARKAVYDVQVDSRARGGYAVFGFGRQWQTALWVEYGHRMVGHRPGRRRLKPDVPAHPFMRPGFEASADLAIEAFAVSLQDTLKLTYP